MPYSNESSRIRVNPSSLKFIRKYRRSITPRMRSSSNSSKSSKSSKSGISNFEINHKPQYGSFSLMTFNVEIFFS
jgi:hypothetical protein